jgi:hypothetical protein
MIIPSKHSGYGEGGRLTSTRRVYDSGGGGTQTSIQDLPDWAKGTAKNVLGAAESTVFKKDASGKITGFQPYQQYGGERTAQFTPLQQQAYGDAYNMDAGPQSFAQNIGTYMSPYQQNVIDREKMEAARASQLLGQQQQAQATQAGAFGGYREGIQRAERERGLRSQMQDIQTRGSQAAFDRASDQFRQGVTQNLAIGQQQAQFGAQQQGQVQKALDTAYQDFANQQKFPMQQIGYLSDILRGTPMGGTSTFYGGQGNTLGQIAGIGAGLYGMFGRAEGGMVDSYADGGVTSDDSVKGILDDLSIDQLKQSRQIAASSGDAARVQMIDEELAQRASEKRGMSSAFNSLPQDQQAGVISAAGGGILAFAEGTTLDEIRRQRLDAEARARAQKAPPATAATGLFPEGSVLGMLQRGDVQFPEGSLVGGYQANLAKDPAAQQAIQAEQAAKARIQQEEAARKARQAEVANYPPGVAPMTAPQPTANTYTRRGGDSGPAGRPAAPVAKAKPLAKNSGLAAAANAVATAAEATTGTDRTSMKDAFTEGLNMVRDTQGEADSQRMVDLINKISKVDAPDKMQMLSDFGFRMAAAASKPGARFLGAAAEGAQVVPETMAQYRKDKREATKLGATLEVEKLKYDSAIRRGDRSAAMQHAQNIRVMQSQEAQLAETKRHNTATERNQAAQIAAQQARYAAAAAARKDQYTRIKAQLSQKAMTQATKDWKDDLTGKGVRAQYPSLQAYQKSLYDTMWAQSMPELKVLSEED